MKVKKIQKEIVEEMERKKEEIEKEINVGGMMNVKLEIKEGEILIIEVNKREQRKVNLVEKKVGKKIEKVEERIMEGERIEEELEEYGGKKKKKESKNIEVKEEVLKFESLKGVDKMIGKEMR